MRFFLEVAGLLVVVGVPAGIVALVWRSGRDGPLAGRRRREALDQARWSAQSRLLDDRTIVTVSKSIPTRGGRESLGEMVVAEIQAADPDWDVKLSQALLDARVRAEILNQESAPSS